MTRLPTIGMLLLCAACALGPRIRPIERLCRADDTCWAQVHEAPDLVYSSIEQAASYGLAYLHELPLMRYPQFGDAGILVYPGPDPDSYRIDVVEVGIENHVMVQLGDHAVAWAHAHPQPIQRDCSPLEGQVSTKLGVPVYVQHAEGPVLKCGRTVPSLQPDVAARRSMGNSGTP